MRAAPWLAGCHRYDGGATKWLVTVNQVDHLGMLPGRSCVPARLLRTLLRASRAPRPSASAAAAVVFYLREIQPGNLPHLRPISFQLQSDTMKFDAATQRNLELVRSALDGGRKGTLLDLMDETLTAMGGRLMKRWVLSPLNSVKAVSRRGERMRRRDAHRWTAYTRGLPMTAE